MLSAFKNYREAEKLKFQPPVNCNCCHTQDSAFPTAGGGRENKIAEYVSDYILRETTNPGFQGFP